MNSTALISHESISRRAHQIWEESGRPDGNETANWLQAESELRAQQGKTGDVVSERGKSVEPPAAKHTPDKAPHSANYVHPGVTTDSLHHVRNR
jgi:Protein of unknown function (DUF2934)